MNLSGFLNCLIFIITKKINVIKNTKGMESLFVAFMNLAALFVMWLVPAYFIAFACNGGAAGSSQLTNFAWSCVGIYTLIFILVSANVNDVPPDEGDSITNSECDNPINQNKSTED